MPFSVSGWIWRFVSISFDSLKDIDCILAAADETFAIIKKALDVDDVDTMLKCPVRQVGFRRLV